MIVGQVIDRGTGQPASEAIVTLTMPKYQPDLATTPKGRVMTDGEGRFFFTELPAGEYYLQSTKDGYASGSYGQRKPSTSGQRVTLSEGQRRSDIELPVWKYAVIGGTVVDEAGEPVVGITVKAMVRNVIAGRTRYGNMDFESVLAATDDRGMFRLAQLSPGTYVVVVPSTQTTVPAAVLENPESTLRNELFWGGVLEMSPLGQPRTVQMGEFALMTLNRVLIPPAPSPSGRMQVYRTTFYPAASTAGAATAVTVKAGEERTDLTINLRPGPAMRVSGRLVTPDGSTPPPMMIRLAGEAMTDVTTLGSPNGANDISLETVTGLSDSGGRFVLLGVPPGDYVLQQANRFLARPLQQGKPSYWVSQPLSVGREDVSDFAVQLRPALRLAGRIEFRREVDAQKTTAASLLAVGFETAFGEPGRVFAEVDRDELTFFTAAAGGRYIARPVESGGWFVHSVTLDGKDVTDRILDLQNDATSLVVTYTDRASKVTGTVTDARGAPSATAVVLAFPVDQQRWGGYGSSPRNLKSASTTSAGTYTFEHLPPGDYYLVAVDNADADDWQDPSRLEALASRATRLSVAAGDALKTLDLRIRSIQ